MLNKLQFNNLVISNKNGIQQARIQTINKLVHKIRKLKSLLEKHPDNTKCRERVRKSTETMDLLKKLKRVEIMKNVLLMDKPPAAIITNGLATPKEVGVALLAMNKVMQGLIKRFKTELKLDDKDGNTWKEMLKETSKRRQKIERTEEKRKQRLQMKEQKAMGRNRQEWLEQNNPAEDEKEKLNTDFNANVSTGGKWKIEELETEDKITEISKNKQKKQVSDLKLSHKEKHIKNKKEYPNKKVKKDVSLNKLNRIENPSSEDEREMEITSEHVSDDESEDEKIQDSSYINDETENEPEDSKEEPEETLVVDPFFITDTGENYLSTAIIKRDQNMIKLNNNNSKKPSDFKELRQESKNTKQQPYRDTNNQNKWDSEDNRDRKYQPNKWNNQKSRNDKFKQNKSNNNERDNYNKNRREKKPVEENVEQNIHPSWAAKQKLKPVITNFQGKKIKFGDVDTDSSTYTQPKNSGNKTQPLEAINKEKDSIHPSWVAKQKLKPTITAFQGKKITFDNDD